MYFLLCAWVRGSIRHLYVYTTCIEHISWNGSRRSGNVFVAATYVLQIVPCMCYVTFRFQSLCSQWILRSFFMLVSGSMFSQSYLLQKTKDGTKERTIERTLWSRVILELILFQLFKKLSTVYGNRRSVTVFARALCLSMPWARQSMPHLILFP
jgi:hypothetical protein